MTTNPERDKARAANSWNKTKKNARERSETEATCSRNTDVPTMNSPTKEREADSPIKEEVEGQ